jgi:hypothetical protein
MHCSRVDAFRHRATPTMAHRAAASHGYQPLTLTLQLPFCFEVRPLSGGLVSSAPERPCDDVCGLDPLPSESDGDAANFLD